MPRFVFLLIVATLLADLDIAGLAKEPEPALPGSERWHDLFEPDYIAPKELPLGPLRKQLFESVRPLVQAAARQHPLHFDGSLKVYRNWAWFTGKALDAKGRPVKFPETREEDACALWVRTDSGAWLVVDFATGYTDYFFGTWCAMYGAPIELLGSRDVIKRGTDAWERAYVPAFRKPTLLQSDSELRRQLWSGLLEKVQREAKKKVTLYGEIRVYRNWASFRGSADDPTLAEPSEFHFGSAALPFSSRVAALWLRTALGWRLISFSPGFVDPVYADWPLEYGAPEELVIY